MSSPAAGLNFVAAVGSITRLGISSKWAIEHYNDKIAGDEKLWMKVGQFEGVRAASAGGRHVAELGRTDRRASGHSRPFEPVSRREEREYIIKQGRAALSLSPRWFVHSLCGAANSVHVENISAQRGACARKLGFPVGGGGGGGGGTKYSGHNWARKLVH